MVTTRAAKSGAPAGSKRKSEKSSPPAKKSRKGKHEGEKWDTQPSQEEEEAKGVERTKDDEDSSAQPKGHSEIQETKEEQESPSTSKEEHSETQKQMKSKGEADPHKSDKWQVIERGIFHILYRPKVQSVKEGDSAALQSQNQHLAESFDDVQRTHIILLPSRSDETHDEEVAWRMLTLGKKRLPSPELALSHGQTPGGIGDDISEAIWATITEVGHDVKEIAEGLGAHTRETKTRGLRLNGSARPAGRGHYVISKKEAELKSKHEVRLSYHLSHPTADNFGEVQEELGLERHSDSIMLQLRNPTLPQTGPGAPPAGLPKHERVELSKEEMQEAFGGEYKQADDDDDKKAAGSGTRYGRPEHAHLLDHQGIELLLIKKTKHAQDHDVAASDEAKQELERAAHANGKGLSDDDVLHELKMSSKDFPPEALSGRWV